MRIPLGRAALAAFLFLGAQVAPGLHAALEAGHDVHVCCKDGETRTHFDACDEDHSGPHCPVCEAARAPASAAPALGPVAAARVSIPAPADPLAVFVDPFHVEIPDSRGPPA